jgi:hypothetical protein
MESKLLLYYKQYSWHLPRFYQVCVICLYSPSRAHQLLPPVAVFNNKLEKKLVLVDILLQNNNDGGNNNKL